MKINHQVVVFDAADLTPESNFWAGVLDGTVGPWLRAPATGPTIMSTCRLTSSGTRSSRK